MITRNFSFILGDLISRLNTGGKGKWRVILVLNTRLTLEILKFLHELGLILNFSIYTGEYVKVFLKYSATGRHCFRNMVLISKPGKRVYWGLAELSRNIEQTTGTLWVISTSQGLCLSSKCLWERIGGEPLFKIYI